MDRAGIVTGAGGSAGSELDLFGLPFIFLVKTRLSLKLVKVP